MIKNISTILIAFIVSFTCFAQENFHTKSRKAIKYYEEAQDYINMQQNYNAINKLKAALYEDYNFIEAHIVLAELFFDAKDYENAIRYFQEVIRINPDFYPSLYVELAESQMYLTQYKDAQQSAETYLSKNTKKEKLIIQATRILSNCKFAQWAIQHPVPYNPVNLGDSVNTNLREYWPSLSADEKTLVFTRLIPIDPNLSYSGMNMQEDFFICTREDSAWRKYKNLGEPINTLANEGAQSITPDGKMMYFTSCGRPDGLGNCDIYFSKKVGDKWSKPVNLGKPVNSSYSEKQPSISPDGTTLYFLSNRPGGKGDYDIWYSVQDDNGKWCEPINMGDSINTPYKEQSPFIHFDNKTLYFASDGWPGMGNLDIFFSTKKEDGTWTTPRNIGYPINTQFNEMGLIVNALGNKAYFASDRIKEKSEDIYEFDLYKEARPSLVSYIKGVVFNAETKAPLSAKIELIDLNTAKTTMQSKSSASGEFEVCIPTDKDYALNVSANGYLFFSENFTMKGVNDKTKPFLMDVPMQPIKPGEKIILKNIFFETNSFELKNTSIAELGKLIQFMKDNATVRVEIGGHTDNVGSDSFNLGLSENRAKAVVDYIVKNGIEGSRLNYKGYGKSKPVADNNTEEGRSKNRRTECMIVQ